MPKAFELLTRADLRRIFVEDGTSMSVAARLWEVGEAKVRQVLRDNGLHAEALEASARRKLGWKRGEASRYRARPEAPSSASIEELIVVARTLPASHPLVTVLPPVALEATDGRWTVRGRGFS